MSAFDKKVGSIAVKEYSNVIGEAVEKLKLPIAYFSTKILDENIFPVFKPLELGGSSDACYIVKWLINYCRDSVRNPLLPHDEEIVERKNTLRAFLRVP